MVSLPAHDSIARQVPLHCQVDEGMTAPAAWLHTYGCHYAPGETRLCQVHQLFLSGHLCNGTSWLQGLLNCSGDAFCPEHPLVAPILTFAGSVAHHHTQLPQTMLQKQYNVYVHIACSTCRRQLVTFRALKTIARSSSPCCTGQAGTAWPMTQVLPSCCQYWCPQQTHTPAEQNLP